MAFETRALTGTMLAQRYLVAELHRETDAATQFRGEDTRTGGSINVDVVREGLGSESKASKALELGAMTACEIRHPNVVMPYDIGVLEDGSTFVITPRLSGETLEDRVCLSGPLPVGDVVRIGLDLLSALAAAHDLQITHGDLRPESVFLVERDGLVLQTLLSGFGRDARFANRAFVAPEVADGAPPSIASDLYACAAILYLAATGYPPHTAPASAPRPELPARLLHVLVQALQADPSRRFACARDMLHALDVTRGAFGIAYAGSTVGYESRGRRPANDLGAELEETRVLSIGAMRAEQSRRAARLEVSAPAVDCWTKSDVVPSLASLIEGVGRPRSSSSSGSSGSRF